MSSRSARRLLTLWGLLLCALSLTLTCHTRARAAGTIFVNVATGSDANPGTMMQPKQSIGAGIAAAIAMACDTILVADGLYVGANNKNLTFAGNDLVVKSVNGPAVTIIDCQDAGRGFILQNGETAAARVEGFTIRNGDDFLGGGMYIESSSPTVTNCTFSGNTAAFGSGIYVILASPTVTNCAFSGNTGQFGGGMYVALASPTVTNCAFSGNSVSKDGGGMYIENSIPAVANCTFSGNAAAVGGGMHLLSASPAVTNCTFSGNSGQLGGGVAMESSSPAVTNCILWGNSPDQLFVLSGTPTVTYSDVQGGFPGMGNTNADPLFVRNPSPGMDMMWGTMDDDFGDLHLQPNSPCMDAGNNAAVPADTPDLDGDMNTMEPLPFDRDGKPRFVDGPVMDTGSGTAPIVDMGAFEFAPPPLPRPIALTLTNSFVTGGGLVGGRVTLDQAAPMGGLVLTFTSAPNLASINGGMVTVPAGQTTFPLPPHWFTIQTMPVAADMPVVLKVEANGGDATANLLIKRPYVWRLRFSPNPTKRNQATVLFGELTGPVPATVMIPLTSTNQAVFADRTVTVLANQKTFTVNFTPNTAGVATVTATFPAGRTASANLVVNR
jgi:parallel beta helix pectate lyase-like protein